MTFKKVKVIEQMPLDLGDRVDLLLVYANKKPATELFISPDDYTGFRSDSDFEERLIPRIEKALKQINKPYTRGEERVFEAGYIEIDGIGGYLEEKRFATFFIGKDENWMSRLQNAYRVDDDLEKGLCYGFPERGTQAFLGNVERFEGESFCFKPNSYFTQFIFAKDSYNEQFKEVSLPWHDAVKKLSKNMYFEIQGLLCDMYE